MDRCTARLGVRGAGQRRGGYPCTRPRGARPDLVASRAAGPRRPSAECGAGAGSGTQYVDAQAGGLAQAEGPGIGNGGSCRRRSSAEHDAQLVVHAVVMQENVVGRCQRLAVQFDARHAAANVVRILYLDVVGAGMLLAAMPIAELKAGPALRDARVDAQPVAAQAEAENRLQRGAIKPGGRAGVPGPAAAADVRRHRIDVRADHVRFHLVARDRLGAVAVMDRVEQVEQRAGAVAVAEAGPGEDRPDRAMRVLPAVLAHARWIALDVAGILLAVLVERRREQARQLVL